MPIIGADVPAWARFQYHWLHIPTGKTGQNDTALTQGRPMTRQQFLEMLERWNAQQPGRWQYWARH